MGEWTTVYKEELAMEMAVKAAAMEERARRRRRRRMAVAGRLGERRPLTPFLHDFLVL